MQTKTADLNAVIASKIHLVDVVLNRLTRSRRFAALDPDDAYSIAQVALWKAVESHDPSRSTLDAHIKHRIRYALLNAVEKVSPPVEDGAEEVVEELCDHNKLDARSVRAWRESLSKAQASGDLREALDGLSVQQAQCVKLLSRHSQGWVRWKLGMSERAFAGLLGGIRRNLSRFRPYAGSDATVYTTGAHVEDEG